MKAQVKANKSTHSDKDQTETFKTSGANKQAFPNVAFTRLVVKSGSLTKSYQINDAGEVVKGPSPNFADGIAELMTAPLDGILDGSTLTRACNVYGLPTSEPRPDGKWSIRTSSAAAKPAAPGTIARTKEEFAFSGPGVLLLDNDPNRSAMPPVPALTGAEIMAVIEQLVPEAKAGAYLAAPSASSGIYIEQTGEPIPGKGGVHLYLAVEDAADIERFGSVLFQRLWLSGYGSIALSASGAMLVRSIIDPSVFQSNRIDYIAPAALGKGLGRQAGVPETRTGGYLDTRILPDLTDTELVECDRLVSEAKNRVRPQSQKAKTAFVGRKTEELINRGVEPAIAKETASAAAQEGQRVNLGPEYTLIFAELGQVRVRDVLADLVRFDRKSLADPIEGTDYGTSTATFYANVGNGVPCIHSHAHGAGVRFFLLEGEDLSGLSGDSEEDIPPESFEDPLEDLQGKLQDDPHYVFRDEVLRALLHLESTDPYKFSVAKATIKKAGIVMGDLEKALAATRSKIKAEQTSAKGNRSSAGQYAVSSGSIYRRKEQASGETMNMRLCNFDARIVREVMRDDGAQVESLFTIRGVASSGRDLGTVDVAFSEFASLSWVTRAWGNLACIEAGQSNRDHLRAAIQQLSGEVPRQTIYAHTGWRKIDGEWRYLHAQGALGEAGSREDIEVDAGAGHMKHYSLPKVGTVDDIRASLSLFEIAPARPEVGATLLASIYRAAIAECAPIDVSLFMAGATGAFKSEASGLMLQHFGGGFSARALPGNWSDTVTDLEMKSHAAKDAIFCIDDFKPNGRTKGEADRLHNLADRIFRAVGNHAGRGRRAANLRQRPDYPARGFVVASGEDLPRGQSCRARLVILDFRRGDIPKDVLTRLQGHGRDGAFARSMAAFIGWLAPKIDQLKVTLGDELIAERDRAIQLGLAGSHDRVPDNVAQLVVGAKMLSRFAEAAGAITDAATLDEHLRKALYKLAEAQGEHLKDQDEINRFFDLLGAVIAGHKGYLLDLHTQSAPDRADAWGWERAYDKQGNPYFESKGDLLGWVVDPEKVYLQPDATFAAVVKLAQAQGESFSIAPRTLWKRMAERGFLLERSADRDDGVEYYRNYSRKMIGGRQLKVLTVSSATFLQSSNPDDEKKPDKPDITEPTGQASRKTHTQPLRGYQDNLSGLSGHSECVHPAGNKKSEESVLDGEWEVF
jgi:hypothetical protein